MQIFSFRRRSSYLLASRRTLLYHSMSTLPTSSVRVISTFGRCDICDRRSPAIIGARIDYCNNFLYTVLYGAEPQPSPGGTERDGSHRASGFLPDERHGSVPTAALVTDQTTDHVQAGDPYFQGEVLSDPTVSSRTASRPAPGYQATSIYYRYTALRTI